MWLFDDLLGKTGNASSGSSGQGWSTTGGGGTTDPTTQVIVDQPTIVLPDTPQITSISPNISDIAPIVEMDAPASEPIIISEAATPELVNTDVAQAIVNPAVADLTDLTPTVMPTPVVTEDVVTGEPVIAEVVQPLISNEITEVSPLIADTPISTTPNLLASTEDRSDTPIASSSPTPVDSLSSLMQNDSENHLLVDSSSNTEIHSTEDFLKKSISDIDVMIASMQSRHESKLAEVADHREKKNHYAKLEREAQQEADSMIGEQARAEQMKSYLQSELKWGHKKASVKTALTEIGTKESISKTIKHTPQKSKIHA